MNKVALIFLLFLMGLQSFAQRKLSSADSTKIKELFFTGVSEKIKENYDKANESFMQIVNLDPDHAAVHYEIALVNYRQNKLPEAETAIKKAVLLDSNNVWYWNLLAELYKRKGDMPGLLSSLDRLIRLSPDQEAYYFDRSNAFILSGKPEEAVKSYHEQEQKFGLSELLMKAKQHLLLLKNGAPPAPEEDQTDKNKAMANVYLSQNKLKEAASSLKIAIQGNQNDPKLFALYGDVLYRQGYLNAALEQYQLSLKLTDQLYFVWEQVLNIQNILGRYKNAIQTGEAALSIYPNQAILYYYVAFAMHRDDQNAPALLNVKTALQLDGENKTLQALILSLQGEIFIDEHKFAAANAAFDQAVTLSPKNYMIFNSYAYYLALRNQDLEKAASLMDKAAKARPENSSIADTYAFILFKLKKYDLAKYWIEKALQNNEPNNPVYLEHYGDILFLKGEQEQALVQWQKASAAGNDSDKLKQKINEKKYYK